MSAQDPHSSSHFVLDEQDELDRHLGQQQVSLMQFTQAFFLISLGEHYASVEVKLIPIEARQDLTRQCPCVGISFARCCKTSVILDSEIVTEKVQRILETYFGARPFAISYVQNASDSDLRYGDSCWKAANGRLEEFRWQALHTSNMLTQSPPVTGRLHDGGFRDGAALYSARRESDVDREVAAIGKVFSTLIRNLHASLIDFKKNPLRRPMVSNTDLLQMEGVRYSGNPAQRELDLWCASSKQGNKPDPVSWYLHMLASNLCLYRRQISGNVDDGIDFVPEVCAKTRRRWQRTASDLNELVCNVSRTWGPTAYMLFELVARNNRGFRSVARLPTAERLRTLDSIAQSLTSVTPPCLTPDSYFDPAALISSITGKSDEVVRRALHLPPRTSIRPSPRQDWMATASLLAGTQGVPLAAPSNVFDYARNTDDIMETAFLSTMAETDNNHGYDLIAPLDGATNPLPEFEESEPLTVVQRPGALYAAPCSRCEIRHYMRCVASTGQAHDIARPHQGGSILGRSELATPCSHADLDDNVYIIPPNMHIKSPGMRGQFQKRV